MAAQNICDKFNQISNKCTSLQDDKFQTIETNVETINSLLNDLAVANQNHVKNNQSSATQV
jgi:flagellar hook-associated protein FlgK